MKPSLFAPLLTIACTALIMLAVQLVHSAPPPTPACPPASELPHCVRAGGIKTQGTGPFASVLNGSRLTVTNESTATTRVWQYWYDITGTAVLTDASPPLYSRMPYNYYPPLDALGRSFSGTLVLTGTVPFTLQVVNPAPERCPNNIDVNLCGINIYLTENAAEYTLANNDSNPISQTHDIYNRDVFVLRQHHEVPSFGQRTFAIPTATPGAVASRAASVPQYRVEVLRATASPIPVLSPTPISPRRYQVFAPAIARR